MHRIIVRSERSSGISAFKSLSRILSGVLKNRFAVWWFYITLRRCSRPACNGVARHRSHVHSKEYDQNANADIARTAPRTWWHCAVSRCVLARARDTGFAAHLGQVWIELTDSILHRDNP
jgi:hypothetical protein